MGIYDPKRLVIILDDLQGEMRRWSSFAGDMVGIAQRTQGETREHVTQIQHRSQIINTQINEDRLVYRSHRDDTDKLLGECRDAIDAAKVGVEQAQNARQAATRTLDRWTNELNAALAWLERAKRRMQTAEQWVARAERSLDSAVSSLNRARADLANCRNSYSVDSDGNRHYRDCSGYANAVRNAESEVRSAEAELNSAREELRLARLELQRAQARVNCCTGAVNTSKEAVKKGTEAVQRANSALSSAEQAMEYGNAAERSLDQAQTQLESEEAEGDRMLQQAQQADNACTESHAHFLNARRHEETAQRYRVMFHSELERKIALLNELNRPNLITSTMRSSASNGGTVARGASASTATSLPPVPPVVAKPALDEVVVPRDYADEQDGRWLYRIYAQDGVFMLRVYDQELRVRIPDFVTPGDGATADIILERDDNVNRAAIRGFEPRRGDAEGQQDAELLMRAERFAHERGASSVYISEMRNRSNDYRLRNWYRKRGYSFNLEEQRWVIYKDFMMENA